MAKFRIVKRGSWYVPQRQVSGGWADVADDAPGDPWVGLATLQGARDVVTAGFSERTADEFIEEIER